MFAPPFPLSLSKKLFAQFEFFIRLKLRRKRAESVRFFAKKGKKHVFLAFFGKKVGGFFGFFLHLQAEICRAAVFERVAGL